MSESKKQPRSGDELHPLELRLIEEKIRHEAAQADMAALQLDRMQWEDKDYQVKTGRIRHLYINDAIGGMNTDVWLDALKHWERRDPGQPITVSIFSPGGRVLDGLALYDQLQRMRRKGHTITTHGTGIVASMAAVLLQAGDERIIDARAKMLIHEGSGGFSGTVGEMEDYKAFSDMLREDILDILAERSTLTRRQIQTRWRRKDWYLSADEALKCGFVDRIE